MEVKRRKEVLTSWARQNKGDSKSPGQVTGMGTYHLMLQMQSGGESTRIELRGEGAAARHGTKKWRKPASVMAATDNVSTGVQASSSRHRETVKTWITRTRKQRPLWELGLCSIVLSVSLAYLNKGMYYTDHNAYSLILQLCWGTGNPEDNMQNLERIWKPFNRSSLIAL